MATGRIRSFRGLGSDSVLRTARSFAGGAPAGRFRRWVDGHPVFDAAMSRGRPVDAVLALARGWATTARVNLAGARRTRPNPIGFPQQHSGRLVMIGGAGSLPRFSALRRAQAVVLETSGDWPSPDTLIELAASGVPLVCERGGVAGLIDGDVTYTSLRDVRVRELHSVRLRRRALQRLYGGDCGQSISVILATRRPADLPNALDMIARQQHPPLEVLVGLHGDQFGVDTGAFDGAGRQVFRYGDDVNLGEVLQDLTRRSRGVLVTKWDDDDWYGRNHLHDLAMALTYSGADLVGKAAEFVYLEDLDVTMRRMSIGAETFSTTLAGGALMIRREALDRAGGWPLTPRHVDLGIIDRVADTGGRLFRTHGFEYLLRRRSAGHTWSLDSSYFVAQSIEQRPGLDLAFAGIDDA